MHYGTDHLFSITVLKMKIHVHFVGSDMEQRLLVWEWLYVLTCVIRKYDDDEDDDNNNSDDE